MAKECEYERRLYVDPKALEDRKRRATNKRTAYDSFQLAVAILPENIRPKLMPTTMQGALNLIEDHFTSPETAHMVAQNGFLRAAFKQAPEYLKEKVTSAQKQAQPKLQARALLASIRKARGLTVEA